MKLYKIGEAMVTSLFSLLLFALVACAPNEELALQAPLAGPKREGLAAPTPERSDSGTTTAVPTTTGSPVNREEIMTEEQTAIPTRPRLERVPTSEAAVPVVGEVPEEHLEAIIADLIERENATREEVHVVRAESVVWSDGSLGCPKPGATYTQALVNGYWIVLRLRDQEFDYRATRSSSFFLCQNPVSPRTPGKEAPAQ